MKKVIFTSLLLFVLVFPGVSAKEVKAEDPPVTILEFTGDTSVLQENPSALLVKDPVVLANYKEDLIKASNQMVILYEGGVNDLTSTLEITDAPRIRTETTTAVVSGFYTRNGKKFVGQILVPIDDPNQDIEKGKSDFVDLLQNTADQIAGPVRSIEKINYYFFQSFLPVIKSERGAYWDTKPILLTTILDCPFGKYNDVVVGQQVVNEDNPYRDYWGTQLEQQILPGNNECPSGDNWYNQKVWNMADVRNEGVMYNYGPYSTFNEQTSTVSIGFDEAGFSLGWSWTFPILNVDVYDYTDFGYPRLEHDFVLSGNAARYTYTSEPGLSVTLNEGMRPLYYRPLNLYWSHWLYGSHHYWDYWYIEF